MTDDIPAINESNGKEYPNWAALVEAETHGFVAVAYLKNGTGAPWVVGPWPTKREANNCRQRMKNSLKKHHDLSEVYFFVRHAWKDV